MKKEKQNKESFFSGVKKELKQIKWPSLKEVMKYTVATIIFCLFLAGFFLLINLLMAFITKGV